MTDLTNTLAALCIVAVAVGLEVLHQLRPTWPGLLVLEARWRLRALREGLILFSAHLLPRWLVSAAAIRLIAHATTGRYGSTVVPELTAMEALRRWETSND